MATVSPGNQPESSSKPDFRTVTAQDVVHRRLTLKLTVGDIFFLTKLVLLFSAFLPNLDKGKH